MTGRWQNGHVVQAQLPAPDARPRRRPLLIGVAVVVGVIAVVAIVIAVTSGGSGELVYKNVSAGMSPTLKVGQTFGVIRNHNPRLGDILVFHPPPSADSADVTTSCAERDEGGGHPAACAIPSASPSSETFVKRVVGLPGDRIAIVDGHVIRDGVRESDPYATDCAQGDICSFPRPITIPAGAYFVLGDNRAASFDSRFWGPVKRAWTIGTVVR
jgi:signal peptidase I